jgi:AmmeMemoRadiSam system protein B
MPTGTELVEREARILRRDPNVENHPFADEFNHVNEHSMELASVWLNWAVGDRAMKMLPVLCGLLGDYVLEDDSLRDASPADHPQMSAGIGLLQQVALHRRTVFVAAADLSHVGSAFGDEDAVDEETRREIEKYDSELMCAVIKGQHGSFLATIRGDGDDSRGCGFAPIFMTLWAAGGGSDGRWMGYQ